MKRTLCVLMIVVASVYSAPSPASVTPPASGNPVPNAPLTPFAALQRPVKRSVDVAEDLEAANSYGLGYGYGYGYYGHDHFHGGFYGGYPYAYGYGYPYYGGYGHYGYWW